MIKRILHHIRSNLKRDVKRFFPKLSLEKIEKEVKNSEKSHLSELCVVIENSFSLNLLLEGVNSRNRAIEIFSKNRVWDTEFNSGILLYILLADRKIEIVADRGIAKLAKEKSFAEITSMIESKFKENRFEEGVILGIQALTKLLSKHYPVRKRKNKNEISDKPILI
ncbi:MAG: TPM domain-containing protein [Leptospiraceae bacterium]|nr:TPM domain-containing protein [Leptospiraceae bacterium]MCK6380080.1 TPM domain-containing protein [Leptospiraceae bacterium]NUM40479.1 TPM domain-containing protein [Leptospiraceae bacterium]